MSLSFARGAPLSVQVFSWAFLIRPPLQQEVPELQALLAALRRRWGWVAGLYLVFVAVLVLPGLMRERGPGYATAAVVLPHLLLYVVASLGISTWAGFRINMTTAVDIPTWAWASFRIDITTADGAGGNNRRRWGIVLMAPSIAAGLIVGLLVAFWAPDQECNAACRWLEDTITPLSAGLFVVLLLLGVSELVANMRQQQHAMSLQLAEAQTAQERLARVTAESELRLLQAQVEPHFLYNTLANLRFLVQTGSPDALRMTDALIDYLQTSVPDMRAQQVTLGREAELDKLMLVREGDVFSGQRLNESTRTMTELFGSIGYAFANINARPDVDRVKRTVAVKANNDRDGDATHKKRVPPTTRNRRRSVSDDPGGIGHAWCRDFPLRVMRGAVPSTLRSD
jgi:hypothetical protein